MDIQTNNRRSWDQEADRNTIWTKPIDPELIADARKGDLLVFLTEQKPVPADWLPKEMKGVEILCLASGGGQQGPLFAAAGARVTVFDLSPKQLEHDRQVARSENLEITTVEGDMTDLSTFPGGRFDLVFNPVSNLYIPDVHPLWQETYRVLRPGGSLLTGFMNPCFYVFDSKLTGWGFLKVKYPIPYSDLRSLSRREIKKYERDCQPFEFGHSLTDQIGGLVAAGFVITGFYEDYMAFSPVSKYMPVYNAIRACKQ